MKKLFAGIDSSTQSTKLLVIDLEHQKTVFLDSVNYDRDLPHYDTLNGVAQGLGEGVSESDPRMWIESLDILFQRLKESDTDVSAIRAISVSGQQHGLVTLDEAGNLTRQRSKLWNDFSTEKECQLMTDAVGGVDEMISEVGNSQRTGYTAAKIFHMVRHEPKAFEKTSTCFLVHNYINWYLTGGVNGGVRVMEPGDTSGMALWNPKTQQWSERVLDAIHPALRSKLAPIKPADQSIGGIGTHLIKEYGFSPDCLIDAGCGDNMYGAIGTGNVEPGLVTISLGTSGTAFTVLEEAYIDPDGEIAAFCDSTGRHFPLLCVSNLANGYNAVLDQYDIDHNEFINIVDTVPPGNAGRLLIPWYMGERTPDVPLASPVYFGFNLGDLRRENICRAVLEGHIQNLYDGFRKMPVQAQEIRVTGGLAQSRAWIQTIADIFETTAVPVKGEGAAMGAALHAAWVYLKEKETALPLSELVEPFIELEQEKKSNPIPENVKLYRLQKALYQALNERVRGMQTAEDPFALRAEMIKMTQS